MIAMRVRQKPSVDLTAAFAVNKLKELVRIVSPTAVKDDRMSLAGLQNIPHHLSAGVVGELPKRRLGIVRVL